LFIKGRIDFVGNTVRQGGIDDLTVKLHHGITVFRQMMGEFAYFRIQTGTEVAFFREDLVYQFLAGHVAKLRSIFNNAETFQV
jgi:hypothetical protein